MYEYVGANVLNALDPLGLADVADTGWIPVINPRKGIIKLDGTPMLDGHIIDYRIVFDGSNAPDTATITVSVRQVNAHKGFGGNLLQQLNDVGQVPLFRMTLAKKF